MAKHLLCKAILLALTAHPILALPCDAPRAQAIYFINNEAENAVVALPVSSNGTLSGGTRTLTGGAGGVAINGGTNQPILPDALVSQSALTVAGNTLFAVNAGSNTLTMFSIDRADRTRLRMVGRPVRVPGEFPNTVAASSDHNLVCVGMTGAVAGISCASFSPGRGIGRLDTLRPFNLQQSTPPTGPPNTVSQVFFSDDQSTLLVTVKGNPGENIAGFLAAFPVQGARGGSTSASVARRGTRSSPEGTAVLFGSSTIPGSTDVIVTDPSFGAAVLSVEATTGAAGLRARREIEGQAATCWATVSPITNTAFVTDGGVNRLVELSTADASIVGIIDLTANGDPGLLDLVAAGNFLYALSPGDGTTEAAVTVVDVTTKAQVQHFQVGGLGVGTRAMGMAVSM